MNKCLSSQDRDGSQSTTVTSLEDVDQAVHPTILKIVEQARSQQIPIKYSPRSVFVGFKKLQELGSGTYAKVYKMLNLKTNVISAGKLLKPDCFPADTQKRIVQMFSNEIIFLTKSQCQGVVRLYNVIYSIDGVLIDQEFIDDGTVWRDDVCPTVESKWCHLVQLVQAVQFMHSLGIVHRDLKPTNILRKSDGFLKVADFGWSEEVCKLCIVKGEWPGTLEINPPELLSLQGPISERVDNFAVGMNFLLFICNRFVCRPKTTDLKAAAALIMKNIDALHTSKKLPAKFTTETWAIFLGLTQKDPYKRWSLERIWHEPWVVRNFLYMMEANKYDGKKLDQILWYTPARRLLLSYKIPPNIQQVYEDQIINDVKSCRKPSTRLFCKLGKLLDWREKEA